MSAIATDAGPDHGPFARTETTDLNDAAEARKSDANPSHATAAISSGAAPAPVYIRAELTSGGNTRKFITTIRS